MCNSLSWQNLLIHALLGILCTLIGGIAAWYGLKSGIKQAVKEFKKELE